MKYRYKYLLWGAKVESTYKIDSNNHKLKTICINLKADIARHNVCTALFQITTNRIFAFPESEFSDEFYEKSGQRFVKEKNKAYGRIA